MDLVTLAKAGVQEDFCGTTVLDFGLRRNDDMGPATGYFHGNEQRRAAAMNTESVRVVATCSDLPQRRRLSSWDTAAMAGWLADTADGRFSYLSSNSDSDSCWGQSRLRVMMPFSSILIAPMSRKLMTSLTHARPGYLRWRYSPTVRRSKSVVSGVGESSRDSRMCNWRSARTRGRFWLLPTGQGWPSSRRTPTAQAGHRGWLFRRPFPFHFHQCSISMRTI